MEIKRLVLSPLSTNCYLIKTSENSGVVIDPADDANKILKEAEKMGMNIEKILLTHGHFDHFSAANKIIAELQEAETKKAKEAAKGLTDTAKEEVKSAKEALKAAKEIVKTAKEAVKAAKAVLKAAADDAAKAVAKTAVTAAEAQLTKAEEAVKVKEEEKKTAETKLESVKFDKDSYNPTEIAVYIHERDAVMLSDPNKSLAYFCPTMEFNAVDNPTTIKDGEKIEQGGVTFEVMHTPGHSAGSVCYIVKEEDKNYMFAGDTIFRDSIGRSDGYSGDYIIQKDTLKKLRELEEDYIIYPGHGEFTTLSEEKIYNPFINGQYPL